MLGIRLDITIVGTGLGIIGNGLKGLGGRGIIGKGLCIMGILGGKILGILGGDIMGILGGDIMGILGGDIMGILRGFIIGILGGKIIGMFLGGNIGFLWGGIILFRGVNSVETGLVLIIFIMCSFIGGLGTGRGTGGISGLGNLRKVTLVPGFAINLDFILLMINGKGDIGGLITLGASLILTILAMFAAAIIALYQSNRGQNKTSQIY